MPKLTLDREKARPYSLSLTAREIFVLEFLTSQGFEVVEKYRAAINSLGTELGATAYEPDNSEQPTPEFKVWLQQKGWNSECIKPIAARRKKQ